jgi:type II secretory pathway component PulJ
MKTIREKALEGFTIAEMMIVVALSSIITFGAFAILRVGTEQSQLSQTKMTLQDGAREALYKMVQEIRQSAPSRVTIGAGGNSLQFQAPNPTSLVNATYDLNWTSAHTIQYTLSAGQLQRTDTTTNQTSVMANDITAIQFAGNIPQPTLVTITISAQRTLISGRQIPATPLQMTAQAEVRNS